MGKISVYVLTEQGNAVSYEGYDVIHKTICDDYNLNLKYNDFMFWSGRLFNNVKSLIENIEKDDNCYVVIISPEKTISEIFIPDNIKRLKKYLMMFVKDKHTSWEVIYKRERISI